MRIDSLMPRGFLPCALLLATSFGVACNESDGTDEWPGVYPPEAEIDRPKGGTMDAGGSGNDAGSEEDAAPDADTDSDAANGDAADAASEAG